MPGHQLKGGVMPIFYERQQHAAVARLVEEYTSKGMSGRQFLGRAMAVGLSASAAAALLAACGSSSSASATPKVVDLVATWGGSELDAFTAAVAPFESQTGIHVEVESTRDLNATLTTRIQGGIPPDIAVLPNPGKMQQLAQQGHLIPLKDLVDVSAIESQDSSTWNNLGTYNGKLYAVLYKAASKGTICDNPSEFQSNGYQIPTTWDQLIALSTQIASSGKYPWSMGVESGSASGWPAADWIAQIYLNESSPALFDKYVAPTTPPTP